jgi:CheY-like chemotaxis protein
MPKILIIEDEVTIRRVLTKILLEESDTYIVEEAEDGKSGFEKIKNEAKEINDSVLAQQEARTSALAKHAALGLTEEEIGAL